MRLPGRADLDAKRTFVGGKFAKEQNLYEKESWADALIPLNATAGLRAMI
jgi:hypothetical protein